MQHGPGLHMGLMAKKIASFEAVYKGKRKVAEGTYEFVFERPEGLHFSAGQHVRMSLIDPPETDAEGDNRFFSIVSTPQEPDLVLAWRVRDTAFKRVMGRMQPGEKVLVQKLLGERPKGSFVLHEDTTKPAVFIVGGIGIVPAYSMIKDTIQRNLPHKLYLFYSNRRPEDAPYLAELQELAIQNPSLKVIATMTEPEKSAQAWQGEAGFINRVMIEKYVDDLHTPVYYVSGLSEMVKAMQAVLNEMGVSKENILAEEFAGFKMAHAGDAHSRNWKSHLPVVLIALAIVALIILHTGAGAVLSHANLNIFSFNGPSAYLVVALILALIAFKLFIIFKFKHGLNFRHNKKKTGK